jgi:hypothetical protein
MGFDEFRSTLIELKQGSERLWKDRNLSRVANPSAPPIDPIKMNRFQIGASAFSRFGRESVCLLAVLNDVWSTLGSWDIWYGDMVRRGKCHCWI